MRKVSKCSLKQSLTQQVADPVREALPHPALYAVSALVTNLIRAEDTASAFRDVVLAAAASASSSVEHQWELALLVCMIFPSTSFKHIRFSLEAFLFILESIFILEVSQALVP